MNPYIECPPIETENFVIRLIMESDYEGLFKCYNDKKAVELMNDDNCDFGFYVDSTEKMQESIHYWIEAYIKHYFIRFSVVDKTTREAIGTLEGFNAETGVLRIDINSEYEKECYLTELFNFAKKYFNEMFGNEYLVTKAIAKAEERRKTLENCDWEFINTFNGHHDYYRVRLSIK